MSSILKVDTLQTVAGGVPTVADLGLDVSGTVLQVVDNSSTVTIGNSSTSMIYALDTTITPKSATSRLIVNCVFYASITEASGWSLGDFVIYDSNISGDLTDFAYEGGVSGTSVRHNASRLAILDSVGTSARTFKIGFRKHGGTYANYVNLGRRVMTITEIAG